MGIEYINIASVPKSFIMVSNNFKHNSNVLSIHVKNHMNITHV